MNMSQATADLDFRVATLGARLLARAVPASAKPEFVIGPALAAADVGIAMPSGTGVAMDASGITLMRGDPALVAAAIDISRHTQDASYDDGVTPARARNSRRCIRPCLSSSLP